MANVIGKEISEFLRKAEELGATPVLKLFMVPTPELRRTRCEFCGRGMLVNLRGSSRPVCWHQDCPSHRAFAEEEATCLYHVFPSKDARSDT